MVHSPGLSEFGMSGVGVFLPLRISAPLEREERHLRQDHIALLAQAQQA